MTAGSEAFLSRRKSRRRASLSRTKSSLAAAAHAKEMHERMMVHHERTARNAALAHKVVGHDEAIDHLGAGDRAKKKFGRAMQRLKVKRMTSAMLASTLDATRKKKKGKSRRGSKLKRIKTMRDLGGEEGRESRRAKRRAAQAKKIAKKERKSKRKEERRSARRASKLASGAADDGDHLFDDHLLEGISEET